MRRKKTAGRAIVAVVAAALLWAPGARSESVFDARGEEAPAGVRGPVFSMPDAGNAGGGGMRAIGIASAQDTLEISEIELEEEKRPGMLKEIAMVAIVAGAVGFLVYMLINPGDDQETPVEENIDKPIPFARTPLSIIR